ncbi:MAG: hypothetical protein Q8L34_04955 [Candidatus Woesearchaeota archaeon]|nr:hypothetical protein [Candidatus Woesearchaeota archaeon]
MHLNNNTRVFTRDGKIAEILKEVILCIPRKTKVYVIGGAARNAIYYDLFKKSLPQRDYDLLFIGDSDKFVKDLRSYKFVYGKIRRKNEIVLKKKLVSKPKSITDYLVLDIHRSHKSNVLQNLKENSAFTINGFAIPLTDYLDKNIRKNLIALPSALKDLKNRQLRLTITGYKAHPGNLFACLRFVSVGFKPPITREVRLLLEQLPNLEKWRFKRNVNKIFDYVGGEQKARQLIKKLGIKIDIFNIKKLREFFSKRKIKD